LIQRPTFGYASKDIELKEGIGCHSVENIVMELRDWGCLDFHKKIKVASS